MKKTILSISLLALSSVAFAAPTALTAGGKTDLMTAQCAMIADSTPPGAGQTASIQLSQDVIGYYDCTSTDAGLATAHPKGKGSVYLASSRGGKILERKAQGTGTGGEFASTANANSIAGPASTDAMNGSTQ